MPSRYPVCAYFNTRSKPILLLFAIACQEVGFVSPDPPGTPPTLVGVEESFVQTPQAAVDILIVVDDTASMEGELVALAEGVDALFDLLERAGVDWQLGVISADAGSSYAGWLLGAPYIIAPSDSNPKALFSQRLPAAGGVGEAGLAAATAALEMASSTGPNAGFLRPDAELRVLFVSDADDQSDVFLENPVEDFLQSVEDRRATSVAALVGDVPSGCSSDSGTAQAGTRYVELATTTDGLVGSICSISAADIFGDLGQSSITLATEFELRSAPSPQTVSVRVDGTMVDGWEVTGRTLTFHEAPDPGSLISVRYVARVQ